MGQPKMAEMSQQCYPEFIHLHYLLHLHFIYIYNYIYIYIYIYISTPYSRILWMIVS